MVGMSLLYALVRVNLRLQNLHQALVAPAVPTKIPTAVDRLQNVCHKPGPGGVLT